MQTNSLLGWFFFNTVFKKIIFLIFKLQLAICYIIPLRLCVIDLLPAEHKAGETAGNNKRRAGHCQGEITLFNKIRRLWNSQLKPQYCMLPHRRLLALFLLFTLCSQLGKLSHSLRFRLHKCHMTRLALFRRGVALYGCGRLPPRARIKIRTFGFNCLIQCVATAHYIETRCYTGTKYRKRENCISVLM